VTKKWQPAKQPGKVQPALRVTKGFYYTVMLKALASAAEGCVTGRDVKEGKVKNKGESFLALSFGEDWVSLRMNRIQESHQNLLIIKSVR
jgi:hypothetical protein